MGEHVNTAGLTKW